MGAVVHGVTFGLLAEEYVSYQFNRKRDDRSEA